MQGIEQIPNSVNPVNVGIGVFLAFLMVDKISFWVLKFKEKNGKQGKNDTRVVPCIQNPAYSLQWEAHRQETHDALGVAKRVEPEMGKLTKDSMIQTAQALIQTTEMKKQTEILEVIRDNGGSK